MAGCIGSKREEQPENEPKGLCPPRLMFATSMVLALAVTQSMPQTICEVAPEPAEFSTLTAHRRAPGATPTTPLASSLAAAIPATWVPWPLSSLKLDPPRQLTPPTTLRSGWL